MTQRGTWPASPAIYEIYPRSFADSTGSGEGDLNGITGRLEAVAELGVDAIWIAPFYVSPMVDGGYDIADHSAVDPRFGTLDDFDALLARAHDLGLKVMIDMVLNHTSRDHAWFQASLRDDPEHRDWYIWRDAKPDGGPPNNWMSFFGEPAWSWHPLRRQYYLRQFLSCQPSLDLRHEAVRRAQCEVLSFWQARGVDGFRFDAVCSYLADPSMRDNPPAGATTQGRSAAGPENPYSFQDHRFDMLPGDGAAYAEHLRAWAGPDMWLMGEMNSGNRSVELASEFTADDRLDSGYTIDLLKNPVTAPNLAGVLERREKTGCGLTWCLSCHDDARAVSRTGDGSARDARLLALTGAMLPGPWIVWQGEELGQPQAELPYEALHDPFDRSFWPVPPGRDGARVPYPWTRAGAAHGFTDGTPWLPMEGLGGLARDVQAGDPASVLAFYRRVLGFRDRPLFRDGDCRTVTAGDTVLHLRRGHDGATADVVLNFGDTAAESPVAGRPGLATSEADADAIAAGRLPPRSGGVWLA